MDVYEKGLFMITRCLLKKQHKQAARYCRILFKQGVQSDQLSLCYSQAIKANQGILAATSFLVERRNQQYLVTREEPILLVLGLAGLQLEQGNYGKAFEWYLKLSERLTVTDEKVLFNMGYCCARLNDFRTAQNYYSQCLKINGEFEEARTNLSNIKMIQSKRLEAISLGKKWPIFSDQFASNLVILEYDGLAQRIEEISDASALQTVGSVVNKANQAVCAARCKRYSEAISTLKWVIDKLRSNKIKIPKLQYLLNIYLGLFCKRGDRHKEAVDILKDVVQDEQPYKQIVRQMLNESKSRITRSSKGFRTMLRS